MKSFPKTLKEDVENERIRGISNDDTVNSILTSQSSFNTRNIQINDSQTNKNLYCHRFVFILLNEATRISLHDKIKLCSIIPNSNTIDHILHSLCLLLLYLQIRSKCTEILLFVSTLFHLKYVFSAFFPLSSLLFSFERLNYCPITSFSCQHQHKIWLVYVLRLVSCVNALGLCFTPVSRRCCY